MDKVSAFGKSIGSSFTPFATRTTQYVKEQLGQAEDRTQLPPDYIELEKRVDALKQVHQKMLQVTTQYSNESYDYTNIRENITDLGRSVSEKIQLLSTATTAAEAQARSPRSSSQLLQQQHSGAGEDPLATALEKYALASEQVGEARLTQDAQIQARFLAGWNTTLNTNLMFSTRARRSVENSRLLLDAAKTRAKGGITTRRTTTSEDAKVEIEQAEDEFVGQTEEAVGVMKNVLDTPEPLRNLADLIAAQLEFHKKAYEILSELAPVVDNLQVDQEASYRKSREGTS
ncbi:hypothetical protein VE04_05519 [Pseudogymnoascus sp. 24MN13]|nr:hypothetical protein VE04_05519 [Pseudogymnoascus sp. 24MN13]